MTILPPPFAPRGGYGGKGKEEEIVPGLGSWRCEVLDGVDMAEHDCSVCEGCNWWCDGNPGHNACDDDDVDDGNDEDDETNGNWQDELLLE